MPVGLQEAQDLLRRAGVLAELTAWNPVIAGTIPLGVDIEGSDIDVLCEVHDADAFVRRALVFAHMPHFSLHRKEDADPPALVCRFTAEGVPVEIFAQALPPRAQRAYRHMMAERRLLEAAGEGAAEEIRRLKRLGVKTEPAFAEHFALIGDAYETLLEIPDWSDAQVSTAVLRARQVREECPFCRKVDAADQTTVYEDAWTLAFVNRRQANPGHMLVIPRRHIANVLEVDPDIAAALGRTTALVARTLRSALKVSDLNIWQSNGEAAGQEVGHLHVHVFPRTPGDGWFQVYPADRVPPVQPHEELASVAEILRRAL